jgi:hypothetical protein
VAEDLVQILTRFHREVVLPDIERIVGEAVDGVEGRMATHFDELHKRFARLESECPQRVEERLSA